MSRNQSPTAIQNGHQTQQDSAPVNNSEIYDKAISSSADGEFLQQVNFGLGNYTNDEVWQQVESYSNGMFAEAVMARRILGIAIEETRWQLGEEVYESLDDEGDIEFRGLGDIDADSTADVESKREFIEDYGEQRWNYFVELGRQADPDEENPALREMRERTGIDSNWRPPHYKMMEARHEIARGRGARVLDNLFSRVQEVKNDIAEGAREALGLQGGRR